MSLYSIETRGELHPFLSYEWLLTNGMGTFASSTVVGCNTRRYHGLLCAATLPPVGRVMALNRIGELVYLDGRTEDPVELSVNQFGHTFHPRGERFLQRFELDQTARWEYLVQDVRILKELQLVWQCNRIGIRYTIQAPSNRIVGLHLLPFVSLRDFHSLRHAAHTQFHVNCEAWELSVGDGQNKLHLRTSAGQFIPRSDWWYGHTYAIETERGLSDSEDLFVPGELVFKAHGPATLTLWASLDGNLESCDWDQDLARRPDPLAALQNSTVVASYPSVSDRATLPPTASVQRLARAAADFVVDRRQPNGQPGTTVIAGYPWFADWGRDTMISLPGLLLTTGRYTEARQVLSLFAEYVSEGMIPNRFDDYRNEPHYNTVDASLWFIHACYEYLRHTGDHQTFNSRLLDACRAIVTGYRHGTRFHIKMDEADGLISAGDPSSQLTWMDAKFDNIVFTPRHGKAVEINALWYNALKCLGENDLAEQVRQSFIKTFWLNPFRGLCDVVQDHQREPAIRPNQIFAASLPYSPLNHDQQHAVVEVVRRELLTPYGLRTLAPGDPNYRGRFGTSPMQRDGAYHNGTVWPWLIGHFLDAYLRVHENSPDAQRQARLWLQPLVDHLNQGCIGQISECFEGDEPHRPVACPAQAWSVAEALRLAVKLGM
ncbi:MAG TPA: amylo-alpha-1,6-glucosidase [Tepidisphaeraceae bacterium]|nr:amylo-alpha-1,6-glucosidase [Tepidisphaeraceae bacterium]